MRPHTLTVSLIALLGFLFVLFSGCGKLEDPERAEPVGSSGGGVPLPIGPRSSIGTFSLSVDVSPSSVPANGIDSLRIVATLTDSSGRSVAGYTIFFQSELGVFSPSPSPLPGNPLTPTTQGSAITDANGKASIFILSTQAGSSPVTAIADVNRNASIDTFGDLFATTFIEFTAAPGVPGPGQPGLVLTADPVFQTIQSTGAAGGVTPAPVTITADVFDELGQKAGAGVRVEFSASGGAAITPFDDTDANGQATATLVLPNLPEGNFVFTVTGTVIIHGRAFTDTVTVSVNVVPPATPVPTATPTAIPIAQTVDLAIDNTSVPVGGTFTLTATVTDSAGNPAPNASVEFSIANNTCASFSTSPSLPITKTTNASGIATSGLISLDVATPVPCAITFVASSGGVTSNSVSLTAAPPRPGAITLSAPSTVSLGAGGVVTLTATATDVGGNPLPNIPIVFNSIVNTCTTFITNNPSLPTTVTTNASGVATVAPNLGGTSIGTGVSCSASFTASSGGVTSNTANVTILP